jgi:hypothetical protein
MGEFQKTSRSDPGSAAPIDGPPLPHAGEDRPPTSHKKKAGPSPDPPFLFVQRELSVDQKSLSPMPPMPPPGTMLQHGLAAVAEPRSLDGGDAQAAAQLVDDARGQGLALDVLGDDDERAAVRTSLRSSAARQTKPSERNTALA